MLAAALSDKTTEVVTGAFRNNDLDRAGVADMHES